MIDPLFFLYQEDYGTYSRSLAKILKSLTASVILGELAQRRKYHFDRDELISDERYGDGWFYMTQEKMEERTSLSRKEQETALKILVENDLIEQRNFGVPSKRHFRLKDQKILELYGLSKKHSSLSLSDKLDCPKVTNWIVTNGQTAHIDKEQYKEDDDGAEPILKNSFTKDDLHFAKAKMNLDWTSEEIDLAFSKMQSAKSIIQDPIKYCEIVIKKIRINVEYKKQKEENEWKQKNSELNEQFEKKQKDTDSQPWKKPLKQVERVNLGQLMREHALAKLTCPPIMPSAS
jgi:hypothetical protein